MEKLQDFCSFQKNKTKVCLIHFSKIGVDILGEIIVHFDRDWAGNVIRMDYKWHHEDKEFLIKEIPCKKLPFGNNDYLEPHISVALDMVIQLQQSGDIKDKFNFLDIENMDGFLIDLKNFLDDKRETIKICKKQSIFALLFLFIEH